MWRKSSFCNGASACVEVALLADGNVGVRDSKLGDSSPGLKFTADDWREFQRYMDADNMGNYLGPVLFAQFGDDWWEMAHRDRLDKPLSFDDDEAEAFMEGLIAGEFSPEALAAGDGSGVMPSVRPATAPLAPS